MELKPVKSSRIVKVGYDPNTQDLVIEFTRGGRYIYHNVEQMIYEMLLAAESIGKYFEQHINKNPNIKYEKLED